MAKKQVRWNGVPLEEELDALRARDRRPPMSPTEEIALGKKLAKAFDEAEEGEKNAGNN